MSVGTVKLRDLPIEWKRGMGLKKSDITDNGKNQCILYGELFTKHKDVLVEKTQLSKTNKTGNVVSKKGDVLVPATSTASRSEMILAREVGVDDVLLGGDINIIRPKEGLFAKKYLSYFFDTADAYQQLERYITGSTGIIHISNSGIKNLAIPLPPIEKQEKIVGKIEELFSEIDNALSLLAQNIKKIKTYRTSALAKLYRDIAEEQPQSIERIGDVYEVFVGATPSRSVPKYWGGNINWVSSGEVAFKDISNTKETITEEGLKNTSTNIHPVGTVLLAMIGEGKTRGQASILRIEAAHNQNTAAIRVDPQTSLPEYLYYFLMSEYEKTRTIGSGNNQKALNKSRVKDMTIPFPDLARQEQLVGAAQPLISEIEHMLRETDEHLARIKSLKKSILAKAFSGELA